MSNKRSEDIRIKRTQRWLKESLQKLLKRKPYKEIQVKEITSLAEVSRPTFYLHYKSKDELLTTIFNDIVIDFEVPALGLFDTWDEYSVVRKKILHDISMKSLKNWEKNRDEIKIIMDAGLEVVLLQQVQRHFQNIAKMEREQFIKFGKQVDDDIIFNYIIDFISGGVFMLLKRWVNDDLELPREKISDFLTDIILSIESKYGFRTKG
jgi:AcrR family transcriptional regulator